MTVEEIGGNMRQLDCEKCNKYRLKSTIRKPRESMRLKSAISISGEVPLMVHVFDQWVDHNARFGDGAPVTTW
jgi:hypothetical protein